MAQSRGNLTYDMCLYIMIDRSIYIVTVHVWYTAVAGTTDCMREQNMLQLNVKSVYYRCIYDCVFVMILH